MTIPSCNEQLGPHSGGAPGILRSAPGALCRMHLVAGSIWELWLSEPLLSAEIEQSRMAHTCPLVQKGQKVAHPSYTGTEGRVATVKSSAVCNLSRAKRRQTPHKKNERRPQHHSLQKSKQAGCWRLRDPTFLGTSSPASSHQLEDE